MGGDEELARGMARMDPFAYGGGGQFSGNGGNAGGRYAKFAYLYKTLKWPRNLVPKFSTMCGISVRFLKYGKIGVN